MVVVEASVVAVEMIPVVVVVVAAVSYWGNASPYPVRQGGEILPPGTTDIHPVVNNYLDLFVDFVHHQDDTDWNHLLFVLLIPY